MSEQFEPIRIAALDNQASKSEGPGSMMRMVLKLSRQAPPYWTNAFNESWRNHFYMMKRHAIAYSDRIEVVCPMDELESGLLDELKKVASSTNDLAKEHVIEQARIKADYEAKALEEKTQLAELKNRLNFD